MTYNHKNERTLRGTSTNLANAVQYVYDENSHLIGEYTADGPIVEYVWFGNKPVAAIYGAGATAKLYHIITDIQNTPRRLVDPATGAIVWSWDPTAYGKDDPTGSVTFNLRFPGQYYDAATKQHYNLNRYYNPELGRYMEPDPIGLEGGLNQYAYAGGNPVSNVDPDGLSFIDGSYNYSIGYNFNTGYNLNNDYSFDFSKQLNQLSQKSINSNLWVADYNTPWKLNNFNPYENVYAVNPMLDRVNRSQNLFDLGQMGSRTQIDSKLNFKTNYSTFTYLPKETKNSSVQFQLQTSATKMMGNLENMGYTKSSVGGGGVFRLDGSNGYYNFYPNSKSTQGPSAKFIPNDPKDPRFALRFPKW